MDVFDDFDDIRVDRRRYQVTKAGVPVQLEPRAFDLLVLLIESDGRLVTKKEIFERLWTDTAVTDNALTRVVAQLRKAIGDDAKAAKYIETVPTRGYRWVASLRPGSVEPPEARGAPPAGRRMPYAIAAVLAIGVVAILALARGNSRTVALAAPIALRPVQVTASSALDAFPALSPDGKRLAYASSRSGTFEIVVRELAGAVDDRALTADGQQNVQPAWSPDGASIAYHSRRRGGIWIASALGGAPTRVTEFGSRPAWSPDGRRIAFQSDPYIDVSPTGYGANIPSTIWIVERNGATFTNARALTRVAHPLGAHESPVWSPDGRRIVFVSVAAGPPRFWSVAVEEIAGEPQRVAGLDGAQDAAFTQDGAIMYATGGGPYLLRLAIDPATGGAVAPPQRLLVPGISSLRHVSLSRDGRTLAFAGMELRSELWTMPLTGAAPAAAPARLVDDRAARQTEPVFSPDGRTIAFWSSRSGAGGEIWTIGTDGGRPSPITVHDELFSPTSFTRPFWFPGGRHLAFLEHDDPIVRAVKVDLASRRATTLLEVPAVTHTTSTTLATLRSAFTARDLTIAPDGERAAYSQLDPATGRQRLFVRSLREGSGHPVTNGEASERYPVWSPDGRLLAFEWKKDAATNIAVVPAAGGEPRALTASAGEHWPYGWSPDGDKVAFAALREGLWNLWWVSLSTGTTRQLTDNHAPNAFVRYPAWSPRGDRMAFELGTVTGNVWAAPAPR